VELARQVRSTRIDFASLGLPADVTHALADAFWHHFGVRDARSVLVLWANLKVFGQFALDTAALTSLADVHRGLLARYVEWLGARRRANGQPWTKSSCASAYTTLRKLLQWLERCRPGVLDPMEYPYNPFPWRNRDTALVCKLPAAQLRAILARTLANAGLTLGVCDWGFCVYRQDHSACLGSTSAPNPVRREPSTCASCRNFAVGPQHLAYWQGQVSRHEALLNDPALPRQTLQIARERLREALAIVRSCDPSVTCRATR